MNTQNAILVLTVGACLLAMPGLAQDRAPIAPQPGSPPEDCRITPERQADGQLRTDGENPLSETLENCGGVLRPPTVGDTGIVQPPPDKGTTPVIPPSTLPEQQPSDTPRPQ